MFSRSARHHGVLKNDHTNWRTYPYLNVIVYNLPPNVTTLDIHHSLRGLGNISSITIHETRSGFTSDQAEVVFEPPPKICLWEAGLKVRFKKDGNTSYVKFKPSKKQRKNFTIESPIRKGVFYDEQMVLQANSLDFGILRGKRRFLAMRSVTADADNQLKAVLNLKFKEIEIHFPVLLRSENGPRMRRYRFRLALDDTLLAWKIESSRGRVAYVIHVKNPPWYSRRLMQAAASSHIPEARRWREDDLWTRQTDIVDDKATFGTIDQTVVSLEKNLNSIDISRWTTFKINIDASRENVERQRLVESALHDFNIAFIQPESFEICTASSGYKAPYWRLSALDTGLVGNGEMLSATPSHLGFPVRYQLEVCISQGWLSEYDIDETFVSKLANMTEENARQMLLHVDAAGERIFDVMSIFDDIRFKKPVKARQLPANCVELHHVSVTATGLKLYSPTVEVSNRIIRKYKHYASRFLRVRFEDDNYRGQTTIRATSNSKMNLIFARIKRALRHGIEVAGLQYDFLAWGNSQLREHGCYFFAGAKDLNTSIIRDEMGAFNNEKVVAKRAARMGQCFSTTQPIHLRMPPITKTNTIPDIIRGKYNFSDGVGKISPLAARMVCANLKINGSPPSCYQFRLGGCKGVLAIDPDLHGLDVQVRASQFKFDSSSQELEIIRCSQFWQPFLNRQIIIVLSELGIPDKVFLNMQNRAVRALTDALSNDNAALKALRDTVDPNQMTLAIADLVSSGFRRSQEPFVMSLLHLWRAWSLKYLKEKAKIPVSKGAFVLGVVDETATLRGHYEAHKPSEDASQSEMERSLPEIFIQITNPQSGKQEIIEGVCILARNPSLHPGDVRVVKAVNRSSLHHLCDVVVIPQTGDRDLASMCSGGDLDGDDYMVIWDANLIPRVWNREAFHYNAPTPRTAEGDITTNHIIDFFIDYLQNDFLGRIAHAHLAAADFFKTSPRTGLDSNACQQLVQLHSMAVDYPKTGVPASLPRRLERTIWPHFMEKKSKPYKSTKILGQLYDAVKRIDFRPRYDLPFDTRILNATKPSTKVRNEVAIIKHEYDESLRRIMAQHRIKTEFEVWSTFVINHSKASRDYKFHEEVGQLSKALKDRYHQAVVDVAGGDTQAALGPYAVAAYQLSHQQLQDAINVREEVEEIEEHDNDDDEEEERPKMPFISFPWLFADILGKVVSSAPAPSSQPKSSRHETSEDVTSQDVVLDRDLKPGEYYNREDLDDDGKVRVVGSPQRFQQHSFTDSTTAVNMSPIRETRHLQNGQSHDNRHVKSSVDQSRSSTDRDPGNHALNEGLTTDTNQTAQTASRSNGELKEMKGIDESMLNVAAPMAVRTNGINEADKDVVGDIDQHMVNKDSKHQSNGFLNTSVHMKDPASMTDEEKLAFFGDIDEDL